MFSITWPWLLLLLPLPFFIKSKHVFQQMGVGFNRPSGIDLDDLHIVAGGLCDVGEGATPDPAKAVDPDSDCHGFVLRPNVHGRGIRWDTMKRNEKSVFCQYVIGNGKR